MKKVPIVQKWSGKNFNCFKIEFAAVAIATGENNARMSITSFNINNRTVWSDNRDIVIFWHALHELEWSTLSLSFAMSSCAQISYKNCFQKQKEDFCNFAATT